MAFEQHARTVAIEVDGFQADQLLLTHLRFEEAISSLFDADVVLLSPDATLSPEAALGKSATIRIMLKDGSSRYINGIIARFSKHGRDQTFTRYAARIVPRQWLLTKSTDLRIFQNQHVPDIVAAVFDEAGLSGHRLELRQSYPTLEYCVQYRESNWQFVSRLLEEYGIHYYFVHSNGNHELVLSDSSPDGPACLGGATLRYEEIGGTVQPEDTVDAWQSVAEICTGRYSLMDYEPKAPFSPPLDVSVAGASDLEVYDYPGRYVERGTGEFLAQLRLEEQETGRRSIEATGSAPWVAAGHSFALTNHFDAAENRTYLVLRASHYFTQTPFTSGEVGGTDQYSNSFVCVPSDVPYRPPRATPKPVVQGGQSATVVGKSGEEIWVDKLGRVKVQFHWDRRGQRDENSSCWMRVSQPIAGRGWGAITIPRIGQEVLVGFLEGDPDRPIVVGSVYNGDNGVPYPLPEQQTRTTFKSRSTKSGTSDNFNEIRFEDKKGAEEVYVHAEKDKSVVVEDCSTISVGNNESISIGNDQTTTVGANRSETVGVDESVSVGANRTLSVGANDSTSVGANQDLMVSVNRSKSIGAAESVSVGATRTTTVGAADSLTVGGAMSIQVGGSKNEIVGVAAAETIAAAKALSIGGAYQVSVGAVMNETVGGAKLEEVGAYRMEAVAGDKTVKIGGDLEQAVSGALKAKGATVVIEADTSIRLKCGASTIELTPQLIKINAPLVKINC